MKQLPLIAVACLFLAFAACNQQSSKKITGTQASVNNEKSFAIEGNWETISIEVNGTQTTPQRFPQQFKMFHDSFYSLVMYDESGKFYLACAGPYELDGNMYTETFAYHSDTNYINSKC